MPQIQVKNGSIFYSLHGDRTRSPGGVAAAEQKPVVIMLRGLARSIRHWLGFEQVMAKEFFTVCVESRGIGRSDTSAPWDLSTKTMASDVIEVMNHLEIDRAYVFGVSLGGMVALTMGREFPQRCRGIIAANSSIGGVGIMRISPLAIKIILSGLIGRSSLHSALADALTGANATPDHKRRLADIWASIEAEEGRPIGTAIKQIGAALRFRNPNTLSSLQTRCLIMSGTADKFVPKRHSKVLHAAIPDSEYVEIAGAGHEIADDAPDEVMNAIRKFILKIEQQVNPS